MSVLLSPRGGERGGTQLHYKLEGLLSFAVATAALLQPSTIGAGLIRLPRRQLGRGCALPR